MGPSNVLRALPHLSQEVSFPDAQRLITGCHLNPLVASTLNPNVYIILKNRAAQFQNMGRMRGFFWYRPNIAQIPHDRPDHWLVGRQAGLLTVMIWRLAYAQVGRGGEPE
jgi:hypothetical protein